LKLHKAAKTGLLCVALCVALPAHADQYHSEVREVPTTPAQKPVDPQTLLRQTTDPYGRALLLRDMASTAAQKKDYKQAAQLLEQAIATHALAGPAENAMRQDLTQLYAANGNTKLLLPQLEAQVKTGKAAPETYVALGAAYLEQKRYADAAPLLEKGVRAVPNADLSWKRALLAAYLGSGREKDALPLLEEAVKRDPTHRDEWIQLAAVCIKAGNKERAQAVMEVASRLGYLRDAPDRLRLVTLTAQIGAPFEAGSLLSGWIDSKALADDAANRKLLATLWLAAREKKLALAALDRALAVAPSNELLQQKVQLHMEREEYAEASKDLEKLVAGPSRSGPLLMTLGLARYQQADVDGALTAFRSAQEFAPSKKLAADWIKYLESGRARDEALAAVASLRQRQHDDDVQVSDRLMGNSVSVTAPVEAASVTQTSTTPASGFTPIGAELGASSDGVIPAWDGGITAAKWPAGFQKGQKLKDPYASEQPLFTITAANVSQYAGKLSNGHRQLFATRPGYAMPVYATHRSVAYPQAIYDASQANISRAKLIGSDSLSGAKLGVPFPKPSSGVEIMWNHRVRYRGDSMKVQSAQAVVQKDGDAAWLKQTELVYYRYGNIANPVDIADKNILLYYLSWFGKSAARKDFLALVHETADVQRGSRNVWALPLDIGRMFRIPPVGYDQPFPGSDGLQFIDMVDMYNGAFDRYVWKTVGKRELYLPYNNYRIGDGRYTYAQLIKPGFLNPQATRYELHRVWVIEATERGGKSHAFGKRVFYVDEDSWNVVLVENYQHDDSTLWRFQEGHLLALYDSMSANCLPVVTYDFKDGRYFINRLTAEEPPAQYDLPGLKDSDFTPESVKQQYGRR
jgi:tetratricopeptide (TPR) repeat protein